MRGQRFRKASMSFPRSRHSAMFSVILRLKELRSLLNLSVGLPQTLDEVRAPIQVLPAGDGKGYGIFAQENIPKYTCLLRSKAMRLFDAGSDTLDNPKMLYEKEQFDLVVKNLYPRTMDDLPKIDRVLANRKVTTRYQRRSCC